jgi:hypothetical protein
MIQDDMKTLFWEILARLGFWIPCDKYLPNPKYWDWVLISYYEKGMTYRYIPEVAEYSHKTGTWHTKEMNDKEFINKMCKVTHWHKIPSDKHLSV